MRCKLKENTSCKINIYQLYLVKIKIEEEWEEQQSFTNWMQKRREKI
jgi:hypothetical protein